METEQKRIAMDMQAKLSTLWIFVLLNVIFRDIHELFRPGLLQEMMTGIINGVQVTEGTLLMGGVMIEILIAMVILSRILKDRVNRWANIIVGAIAIPFIVSAGANDMDDIFFCNDRSCVSGSNNLVCMEVV